MATFTVRQFLQGIVQQEMESQFSDITDVIDYLSEANTVETRDLTIHRTSGSDAGAVARVSATGVGTGTDSNFSARSYLEDNYTLLTHKEVSLTIPFDDLGKYGLTKEILQSDKKMTEAEAAKILSPQLYAEIVKLANKMNQFRRDEVKALLANLGATAPNYQKPFGLSMVDTAASRTTAWAFTNKLTALLTTSTYDDAVDILAGDQKNVLNQDYKVSAPMILLHSSSYSLANTIHMPDLTVNVNNRNSGDGIDTIVKAVGVYGDTANPTDWIVLGKNHTIHRVTYDLMNDGTFTNGIAVSYDWDTATNSLKLVFMDRSQMVVDSPQDIVKSIV